MFFNYVHTSVLSRIMALGAEDGTIFYSGGGGSGKLVENNFK